MGITGSIASGANFAIRGFGSDGRHNFDSGWLTTPNNLVLPTNVKHIAFLFRFTDNRNISPADLCLFECKYQGDVKQGS